MTIPLTDFKIDDYSNSASAPGMFPTVQMSRILLGLLAGPGIASGALSSSSAIFPTHEESRIHAPAINEVSDADVLAGELVTKIREGWQLNMTELAEILGISRPTLYNWLNGKTSPEPKLQKQLQTLAAASADWKEATEGSNWDFLLDYTGPRADEVTIRETLGRADVSTGEIREMILERTKQYREAYAQSREILGPPVPARGEPIHESTRKLNKLWAENAKKLHRFRNTSK